MDQYSFQRMHPFRVLLSDGYRYHSTYDGAVSGIAGVVYEVAIWNNERGEYVPVDETAAIGGRR